MPLDRHLADLDPEVVAEVEQLHVEGPALEVLDREDLAVAALAEELEAALRVL